MTKSIEIEYELKAAEEDDDIQDYKKPWVGLTIEERNDCLVAADPCECLAKPEAEQLMIEIENKLRSKNT